MRWRWALPAALVVFVYAALMQAPAATLYAWLAPQPAPLQVQGIDGTVRHGQVASLGVGGHVLLKHLSWRLQPASLLLGRLALHIQGGDDSPLDAHLRLSPFGLAAGPLRFETGLKALLTTAGYPFLPVDGLAHLAVTQLGFASGGLRQLDGTLQVQGLRWDLGSQVLQLGDYRAIATTRDDGEIATRIASVSGPLDVSGTLDLKPDSSYALALQIKPQADAPAQLQQMLRALGRPDAAGAYHIRTQGRLAAVAPGLK